MPGAGRRCPTTRSPARTEQLAPGNQAGAPVLEEATAFQSYLWLTGIDVLAEPAAATIIAFGDSLVDGMGTTPGADASWPSKLARRLTNGAVINMGIAGNRILRETTAWAPPGWPASTATSWRRAGLHARAGGPPPGRQPLDPRKLRV
jgi:lysophospholipase L1-like esterase